MYGLARVATFRLVKEKLAADDDPCNGTVDWDTFSNYKRRAGGEGSGEPDGKEAPDPPQMPTAFVDVGGAYVPVDCVPAEGEGQDGGFLDDAFEIAHAGAEARGGRRCRLPATAALPSWSLCSQVTCNC